MARTRLFFLCTVLIGLAGAGSTLWGQTAGFAYVANCGGACTFSTLPGNVSAYAINDITGALTPVAGSPFPAGRNPFSVTVHPTGQFAYVANVGSNDVSAYSIDVTTGALTPVAGSSFPAGSFPNSVTVDPTGQFAYVANCGAGAGICGGAGTGTVSAYTINGTTGALTEIPCSPFPAGVLSLSVTVDPTGQFAYVANCGDLCVFGPGGDVSAYTINGITGCLTRVAGFPGGTGPSSVTVDAMGQFAYVANSGSNDVSAYTIDGTTGALAPVAGSPFQAGSVPRSVTTTAGPPPPPAP